MSKSVLLDANFSGLEQRVVAHYRSQSKAIMMKQMQELLKSGKSVMTTHDMVVSTPTNDLADAITYGLNPNWLFGDDLYLQPTPHCQKRKYSISLISSGLVNS